MGVKLSRSNTLQFVSSVSFHDWIAERSAKLGMSVGERASLVSGEVLFPPANHSAMASRS
jgi:hypothetical protein